jgi:hypothetical protein
MAVKKEMKDQKHVEEEGKRKKVSRRERRGCKTLERVRKGLKVKCQPGRRKSDKTSTLEAARFLERR